MNEHNYQKILQQIDEASQCSPYSKNRVQLLAISKLQSVDKIRQLHQWGVSDFGENYLQEASRKAQKLQDLALNWHFIGRLQRKKIKDIVGQFELIHSVDSLLLIEEISKRAEAQNLRQKILIQVNLAEEATKGGVSESEVPILLEAAQDKPGLLVCGLMVMPPLTDNPENVREFFAKTYKLSHNWSQYLGEGHSLDVLSMGTSHDFKVAIEEGSTLVRLGRVLMGSRL